MSLFYYNNYKMATPSIPGQVYPSPEPAVSHFPMQSLNCIKRVTSGLASENWGMAVLKADVSAPLFDSWYQHQQRHGLNPQCGPVSFILSKVTDSTLRSAPAPCKWAP